MNRRILALSPTYYPVIGGTENMIYELYSRLVKMGFVVDLIVPNLGGKKEEHFGNFSIYRTGKKRISRFAKFIFYQRYMKTKAMELASTSNYDVIHIHYALPCCFAAKQLRKKLKIPLIITEHHLGSGMDISDAGGNPPFSGHFLKSAYNSADYIVATSKTQKSFVNSVVDKKNVNIIGNGVDCIRFSPKNRSSALKRKYDARYLVITVSRLNKRKNINDIIMSAGIVSSKMKGVKFLIVGTGDEESNLRRLIKEKGLENTVFLTGFVSDRMLPMYYASADLYVSASSYEGFGITYCESMASGTPVVAYGTDAADALLAPNRGKIIPMGDREFLATAIVSILKDKRLLASMRRRSRDYVTKNHDWGSVAKKYADLFSRAGVRRG